MFIFIRFLKKNLGLVLLSHKLMGVEVQNYACYDQARNLKFNMKKCVIQKYIGNSAKNSTELLMPAVFSARNMVNSLICFDNWSFSIEIWFVTNRWKKYCSQSKIGCDFLKRDIQHQIWILNCKLLLSNKCGYFYRQACTFWMYYIIVT